jgi:hypothetical protein
MTRPYYGTVTGFVVVEAPYEPTEKVHWGLSPEQVEKMLESPDYVGRLGFFFTSFKCEVTGKEHLAPGFHHNKQIGSHIRTLSVCRCGIAHWRNRKTRTAFSCDDCICH